MNKHYQYIISGQGIAGTVLALTLIKKGKSVLIIDEPTLSQASRISAGLYNPIVFKRLVKSWMADELIPIMDTFYNDCEKLLNEKFYFKKEIVKLFSDETEKEFWLKKTKEEAGKYLSAIIDTNFFTDTITNPFGAAKVMQAGNLDTALFLKIARCYFKNKGMLLEEALDYNVLEQGEKKISYKNYTADKIIFCEGFKAIHNPFFNWLPFKLTKGELITIKFKSDFSIPTKMVINKGVFILPLGNGTYKVGATYEWKDLTELPTENGKNQLIDKLKKIINIPFEVILHEAGVRPTVNDRRPLIGIHPEHTSFGIFNGMGTKGVMISPYFAQQFVDFLEEDLPLHQEVNIARFNK
ncbi:MAG: FAD-binding oxidoreductase [Bacteroidia bacterium]